MILLQMQCFLCMLVMNFFILNDVAAGVMRSLYACSSFAEDVMLLVHGRDDCKDFSSFIMILLQISNPCVVTTPTQSTAHTNPICLGQEF